MSDTFDNVRILVACNDTMPYVPNAHFESWCSFMYEASSLIAAGKLDVKREHNTIIDLGRSRIAWETMQPENGYTHLYFVDGDMEISLSHIEALVRRNVDVVSGTYFMRGLRATADGQSHEPFPCVSTRDGKYIMRPEIEEAAKRDELIPVHGVGGGSLLVTSDALRKIGHPAFKFNWHIGGNHLFRQGEDEWFSIAAARAGYTVYLDPCVRPFHIGFIRVGFDVADGNGFTFHTPDY
jgi:hypothetical protein